MTTVEFKNGPWDGKIREEESPAEIIFPEGSNEEAIYAFLEGTQGIECACYVLDGNGTTYTWREV